MNWQDAGIFMGFSCFLACLLPPVVYFCVKAARVAYLRSSKTFKENADESERDQEGCEKH